MNYTKSVYIDTTDYMAVHGRQPKGSGAWAFYIGCREGLDRLYFVPGCKTFSSARRFAVQEAQKLGVTYISVGS